MRTLSWCGQVNRKTLSYLPRRRQVRKTRQIQGSSAAGVDSGSRLRVAGEGEAGLRGGPRGDLYVYIHVKPHRVFKRENDDLICEINITFVQAALGDEVEAPTLEGDAKIRIPEGTQSGTIFRLRGKGIPNVSGYGRGDQHVVVKVVTPVRLSEKQKNYFEEFARLIVSGRTVQVAGIKVFLKK